MLFTNICEALDEQMELGLLYSNNLKLIPA